MPATLPVPIPPLPGPHTRAAPMSDGEEEQSTPPKQIRSESPDAEFPEVAKKSDTKTERST